MGSKLKQYRPSSLENFIQKGMRTMFKKSNLLITSISLTLISGAPALAQQEDEIIVTATKRQQTLQETPVSVTVTNIETIEKAQIRDILDLQSVVPSLTAGQAQNSSQTDFLIRGFGNGANNAGIEPSVGIFIDGVYRSRSAAAIGDLPNLERVEVLSGPQSTLFGKNASAGVISIVTSKPSFETQGYAELGLSNYNGVNGKAYLTGALSESAAFSLGGNFQNRDGYVTNLTTGNDLSDRNRFGLRGQILLQPTDSVELRVIADYDKLKEICCYAPNLVNGPTGAAIESFGGQIITDPYEYETALSFEPTNLAENYGGSIQADIELGNITLTSITAYRKSDSSDNGDVDFNSADLIGSNNSTLDINTFTQEVRLASNNDGAFNWLAGGFYFDESLSQTDEVTYDTFFRTYVNILSDSNPADGITDIVSILEALSGFSPGTFHIPGSGVFEISSQDNRAINLFSQADYEITDRLTVTIGASYTNDRKDTALNQFNNDTFSNTDFVTVNNGTVVNVGFAQVFFETFNLPPTPQNIANIDAMFPGTTAAIRAGVINTIRTDIGAVQFIPQLLGYPNAFEDGHSQDENVDYTFRLAYKISDRVNLYGSYATGYKATSWNLSRDSRPTTAEITALYPGGVRQPFNLLSGTRRAEPEKAEVFEIGVKAKFAKGSINLAIFDQTIKNFQSNVFTGAAFTLANAEKQSVRGAEINALWYPIEGFTFAFGGTFLDPKYDSFTASSEGDISGMKPSGIHEISTSTAITYNLDIAGRDAYVRGDWQYQNEVHLQDGGDATADNLILAAAGHRTREVSTINASAGISLGNLNVSVWGRNLFNDEFLIVTFPTVAQPGSFNGYTNTPRTYGLSARYKFD